MTGEFRAGCGFLRRNNRAVKLPAQGQIYTHTVYIWPLKLSAWVLQVPLTWTYISRPLTHSVRAHKQTWPSDMTDRFTQCLQFLGPVRKLTGPNRAADGPER